MNKRFKLLKGNNLETLKTIPDNSIDSIVTDPPYGLSFMNKKWDYDVPSVDFWKEVYRVLKPGGHILSFGGTRTYHRMVVNIEDAGFEIRDQIMWIYGSGFPKSLNIGKQYDKKVGNEREVIGQKSAEIFDNPILKKQGSMMGSPEGRIMGELNITKGNSPYEGWGTALKPANEPICVARKPISEKTVVDNVIKWGVGGINVDGCRIGNEGSVRKTEITNISNSDSEIFKGINIKCKRTPIEGEGRFPANIIFECICDEVIKGEKGEVKKSNNGKADYFFGINSLNGGVETPHYTDTGDIHTDTNCPCYQLDEQSGVSTSKKGKEREQKCDGVWTEKGWKTMIEYSDKGGASRFFYVSKVSKKERNLGLDNFEDKKPDYLPRYSKDEEGNMLRADGSIVKEVINKNTHPTLKPINLMTYLCRLVTPENGIVLDPFMGSGSTGIAAMLEGFRFVGCELDEEYFKIAETRIEKYEEYRKLLK